MSHSRKSWVRKITRSLAACGLAVTLSACVMAEPATLSSEAQQLAQQWHELRGKPGHFSGGQWDEQVDKWQGRKHQLMQQLFDLAWNERYTPSQLRSLLGAPDKVWTPTEAGYADWLRMTEWRGHPTGEFWAYAWRGQHDQLLFAVEGNQLKAAGWLLMRE